MTGWSRALWFDQTGLPWVNPSPNMRSVTAALLYPGLDLLEFCMNYSVGRGTDALFEQVGADWMRGREVVQRLKSRQIPGVGFYPVQFTPSESNFAGKRIEGVRFVVTERDAFSSVRLGLELARVYTELYPGKLAVERNQKLIGNSGVIGGMRRGGDALPDTEGGLDEFAEVRRKYLLYK